MSARDLIILGCASQHPTRLRNQGGYLFRWNGEGLLFDPGEGTQRQFIYADVAPPVVTRIFISHFHGDHCLGLPSMLMRLNLDKVNHEIHCYYPASGQKYFDRLRYGTIYHEIIKVIEHPVKDEGLVEDDGKFRIEAYFLEHGVENLAWRITEPDRRRYLPEKLAAFGVKGPLVAELALKRSLTIQGKQVLLDDVSYIEKGDTIAVVLDTRFCPNGIKAAKNARLLLCESTYLESESTLAREYKHMTAKEAARVAKEADAEELVLTHFSARYQDQELFAEEAREIFQETHAAHDFKRFLFPKKRNLVAQS